jgi:PAS domain S-box-containing protein
MVELSTQELLFQQAFQANSEPLLLVEGVQVLAANWAAVQLFGYQDINAMKGCPVDALWPPHAMDGRGFMEWLNQQRAVDLEWKRWMDWSCRKADGSVFPGRLRITELAGGIFLLSAGDRRAPVLKDAEDAILRLTQFLETVIDNADMWLNVLDTQAHVLVWNHAAEVISGYTRAEVLGGAAIWEWLYPDAAYRASIGEKVKNILGRSEVVGGFETTIRTRSGEDRVIQWDSRALKDSSGRTTGSIAIGRDVTEVKNLRGLLPTCAHCKKIRDDQGVWHHIETYITERSQAQFSHGLCPECLPAYFPEKLGPPSSPGEPGGQ